MNKDLPIYNIKISEENTKQGVGFISLVDEPAIGVDWIKLAANSNLEFKLSADKQMLYGPFLIPNMLIYRHDEANGEYYIRFSAEEIQKIADRFNSDLNSRNINLQHTDTKVEAFVAQNWIVEGDQDKSKNFGFDLADGTWFGGVKVTDSSFWLDKVKTNEVKGFSVEIMADLELQLKNKQQHMNQINLGSVMLNDGVTSIYFDGDAIAVGTALFTDEAMTTPAPDGDWVLEDGTAIKITNGAVESMTPATDQNQPAEDLTEETLAEPVATATALTAEEVSAMIDARFSTLIEEINALKSSLENSNNEITNFRSEVTEKFASTPAASSVKVEETRKVTDKFAKVEERIRYFAKNK